MEIIEKTYFKIPDSSETNYYQVLQAELHYQTAGNWTISDSILIENFAQQLSGTDKSIRRARMLSLGMKHDKFSYIPHFRLDLEHQSRQAGKTDENSETETEDKNHLPISIYPNPNNGEFTIQGIGCESYELFDLTGKMIISGKLDKNIESNGLE